MGSDNGGWRSSVVSRRFSLQSCHIRLITHDNLILQYVDVLLLLQVIGPKLDDAEIYTIGDRSRVCQESLNYIGLCRIKEGSVADLVRTRQLFGDDYLRNELAAFDRLYNQSICLCCVSVNEEMIQLVCQWTKRLHRSIQVEIFNRPSPNRLQK